MTINNHIIHGIQMGGALLSCPRCGSTQLDTRQTVAEELLEHELDRTRLVFCPYKVITSLASLFYMHLLTIHLSCSVCWLQQDHPRPADGPPPGHLPLPSR